MTPNDSPIRVAALYKFAHVADPAGMRGDLEQLCRDVGARGTLLLAHEGINGTIAGTDAAIDAILGHIRSLPGFDPLDLKFARAAALPFHRMKVRVKPEIVTMGQPAIDPMRDAGHYVAADQWNALVDDPATILIDTRNDYEVAIGTFAGAIDPGTKTFRDFPAWFRAERERMLGTGTQPRVAMFCTGGIRCEKATAFLKSEGVDEVYHLQGGILRYLETIPPEDSRWTGECFVFDQRVTVAHGLTQGSSVLCHACRRPVDADGLTSPHYVPGVSCAHCHAERSDAQRTGYAERHRQELLAGARNERHIGAPVR